MKSRAKRKEDAMRKIRAEVRDYIRAHNEAQAVIAKRHEIAKPLKALAAKPYDTSAISLAEKRQGEVLAVLGAIVAGTLPVNV